MVKRSDLLLVEGQTLQDEALDDFGRLFETLAENVARRVAASLGTDPDSVYPPDGDDGTSPGQTNFERLLQGVNSPEAIRAVVLAADRIDIEDFVFAAGADDLRSVLTEAIAKFAGVAEQSLVAQGANADGALDTVSATALVQSYIEVSLEETIQAKIDTETAIRIRKGIVANVGRMSARDLALGIGEETIQASNSAVTEARLTLAEADRFVTETVRQTIDPDGTAFLLAYLGPDDRLTRPFCDELVNKAFTLEQFNKLNNGQTAQHPRLTGGGYNCRHKPRPVANDDQTLKDLGLTRGTDAMVQAANERAREARKPRKKRGRR